MPAEVTWEERYHVPYSQVHAGSRGGQSGSVHLHVASGHFAGSRLMLRVGQALCSNRTPWFARKPEADETRRCDECVRRADRHGIEWPERAPSTSEDGECE